MGARGAVSLAAVQLGKGAVVMQLVEQHLDTAAEKLECALRRLSKLGADPGSSSYWHGKGATSESSAILIAWILGGFLVAASVALLSEITKAQTARAGANGLTESLL